MMLISPPAAVLLMAPAKLWHGAVREQGLASSPTPETQVRNDCAWPEAAARSTDRAEAETRKYRFTETSFRVTFGCCWPAYLSRSKPPRRPPPSGAMGPSPAATRHRALLFQRSRAR